MSLEVEVRLEPYKTVTLAFVTAVAPNRAKVLELARRFGSSHAVQWAIQDAAPVRAPARQAGFPSSPPALRLASRLLVPLRKSPGGARTYYSPGPSNDWWPAFRRRPLL